MTTISKFTIVTFDSTVTDRQVLSVERVGQIFQQVWSAADDSAGSRLIAVLATLDLRAGDFFRVVCGPGSFTAIRIAATVANAVRILRDIRLFSRRVGEREWQSVEFVRPFYAEPVKLGVRSCDLHVTKSD